MLFPSTAAPHVCLWTQNPTSDPLIVNREDGESGNIRPVLVCSRWLQSWLVLRLGRWSLHGCFWSWSNKINMIGGWELPSKPRLCSTRGPPSCFPCLSQYVHLFGPVAHEMLLCLDNQPHLASFPGDSTRCPDAHCSSSSTKAHHGAVVSQECCTVTVRLWPYLPRHLESVGTYSIWLLNAVCM